MKEFVCEFVREYESIEGKKIEGSSRNPLRFRGEEQIGDGPINYIFSASFNVRAMIAEGVEGPLLIENAYLQVGAELICQKATIRSVKNRKKEKVKMASSTHQATFWTFSQQTNVQIEQAHGPFRGLEPAQSNCIDKY